MNPNCRSKICCALYILVVWKMIFQFHAPSMYNYSLGISFMLRIQVFQFWGVSFTHLMDHLRNRKSMGDLKPPNTWLEVGSNVKPNDKNIFKKYHLNMLLKFKSYPWLAKVWMVFWFGNILPSFGFVTFSNAQIFGGTFIACYIWNPTYASVCLGLPNMHKTAVRYAFCTGHLDMNVCVYT